jgi:hypothetical protein
MAVKDQLVQMLRSALFDTRTRILFLCLFSVAPTCDFSFFCYFGSKMADTGQLL